MKEDKNDTKETLPEKSKIAEKEEEILEFWKQNKIFEKSLKKESPRGEFVFYDGPPFATGLPHYGHILASAIKDVIPRYKTMQGFHVSRRWGWDCHGLPIENIVEKELGFKHKKDIKEYGIQKFNEKCREQVLSYAHEWERIIPRMGRFADMENPYRTMDSSFMESVWWVFKQLWYKGLVYEDYRSMHVCPRCETTLSQQEVSEGYKDVKDISVTVKFRLLPDQKFGEEKEFITGESVYILAWTTTPWTLPGNVALAVGKDISYSAVRVSGTKELLIMGSDLVEKILKDNTFEIVHVFKGSGLLGLKYEPPFDYYIKDTTLKNHENGWKVYHADFVTAESGTGIAHEAPAFGADDWELLKQENLPFVQHVNMDGTMKEDVTDFKGMEVKPKSEDDKVRLGTDIAVLKYLQDHGTFFSKENITHAYPHCWRCDSPLLNYATSSWFVSVTKIKDNLLENAKLINWSPEHIKEGRFGKWLEGARDWSISRQRFWASTIPIWESKSGERYVIGSIDELKKHTKRSGNKYFTIRHGEAETNLTGSINTDPSKAFHLTDKGVSQVESSAQGLKDKKIDIIITSPFPRCLETKDIIQKSLNIKDDCIFVDKRIGELVVGDIYEGKTWQEYAKSFNDVSERFFSAPHGGETLYDINKRVGEFIYEIEEKYKDKNILIVSHEATITALYTVVVGADFKEAVRIKKDSSYKPKNAEINEIDFVPLPHNDKYELDLHRPYIDEVVLVNEKGETLQRITDVLDTWFDSGSMPYGKEHYPFENKEQFESTYPAQFIGEGVDQTRAWFYYLHVLAGGLFQKNAFQNVIVNGVVLAEDGKKMSKKLKNYPDPMLIMSRYGADSMRYYMISSAIVKAEDLNFSEQGVDEVHKKIIGKLTNILSFFNMYKVDALEKGNPTILDEWIVSRLEELRNTVTQSLDSYELDRASRPIMDFVEDLSVWYVRRSRERFKSEDVSVSVNALWYTRYVLMELSKIIAPFMPFVAEHIFQSIRGHEDVESVHLSSWPVSYSLNTELLNEMGIVREFVSMALMQREKSNIKVRQPLQKISLYHSGEGIKYEQELKEIIKDEVNVKEVEFVFNQNEKKVVLDTTITKELQNEGDVRELVRAIQDLRKRNNMMPNDPVVLSINTDTLGKDFVSSNKEGIVKPTNIKEIVFEENTGDVVNVRDSVYKIKII